MSGEGVIILPKVESECGKYISAFYDIDEYRSLRERLMKLFDTIRGEGNLETPFFGKWMTFRIIEEDERIYEALGRECSKLDIELDSESEPSVRVVFCPKNLEKSRMGYISRCVVFDHLFEEIFLKDRVFIFHLEDAANLVSKKMNNEDDDVSLAGFFFGLVDQRFRYPANEKDSFHRFIFVLGNDLLRLYGRKMRGKKGDMKKELENLFYFTENEDIRRFVDIDKVNIEDFGTIKLFFERISSIEADDRTPVDLGGLNGMDPEFQRIFLESVNHSKALISNGGRGENFYNRSFNMLFGKLVLGSTFKDDVTISGDVKVKEVILEDRKVLTLKDLSPDLFLFTNELEERKKLAICFAEYKLLAGKDYLKDGGLSTQGRNRLVDDFFELCYLGYRSLLKIAEWVSRDFVSQTKGKKEPICSIPLFLADLGHKTRYWLYNLVCDAVTESKDRGNNEIIIPSSFRLEFVGSGDYSKSDVLQKLYKQLFHLIKTAHGFIEENCVKVHEDKIYHVRSPARIVGSQVEGTVLHKGKYPEVAQKTVFTSSHQTSNKDHEKEFLVSGECELSEGKLLRFGSGLGEYVCLLPEGTPERVLNLSKQRKESVQRVSSHHRVRGNMLNTVCKKVQDGEISIIDHVISKGKLGDICPYIIGINRDDTPKGILMVKLVELRVHLNELIRNENKWKPAGVRVFMIQMIDALKMLHEISVIHLDIKPSNILVEDSDGKVRFYFCDFSLSRKLASKEYTRFGVPPGGTRHYMPLESIIPHKVEDDRESSSYYLLNKQTDHYALGKTFLEVLDAMDVSITHSELERALKSMTSNKHFEKMGIGKDTRYGVRFLDGFKRVEEILKGSAKDEDLFKKFYGFELDDDEDDDDIGRRKKSGNEEDQREPTKTTTTSTTATTTTTSANEVEESNVVKTQQRVFIERYDQEKFANLVNYDTSIETLPPRCILLVPSNGGKIYIDLNYIYEFELSNFFTKMVKFRGSEVEQIKKCGMVSIAHEFEVMANYLHLVLSGNDFLSSNEMGLYPLFKLLQFCDMNHEEEALFRVIFECFRKKWENRCGNEFLKQKVVMVDEDEKMNQKSTFDDMVLFFMETGHLWSKVSFELAIRFAEEICEIEIDERVISTIAKCIKFSSRKLNGVQDPINFFSQSQAGGENFQRSKRKRGDFGEEEEKKRSVLSKKKKSVGSYDF